MVLPPRRCRRLFLPLQGHHVFRSHHSRLWPRYWRVFVCCLAAAIGPMSNRRTSSASFIARETLSVMRSDWYIRNSFEGTLTHQWWISVRWFFLGLNLQHFFLLCLVFPYIYTTLPPMTWSRLFLSFSELLQLRILVFASEPVWFAFLLKVAP